MKRRSLSPYLYPEEIKQYVPTDNNLRLLHLNISSLGYHFHELGDLLPLCNIDFNIISITESRLQTKEKSLISNCLKGYNIEHCLTESWNGGALQYYTYKNDLIYDLVRYICWELEFVYIEIVMPRNKNVIIGCIYRHPNMQLSKFNECFLSELSTKLSKERKKEILLLGDFNIDLLKSHENRDSLNVLDIMFSNSFMPHITSPTRISLRLRTLTDNIFSTDQSDNLIAGNIITNISVHLVNL